MYWPLSEALHGMLDEQPDLLIIEIPIFMPCVKSMDQLSCIYGWQMVNHLLFVNSSEI